MIAMKPYIKNYLKTIKNYLINLIIPFNKCPLRIKTSFFKRLYFYLFVLSDNILEIVYLGKNNLNSKLFFVCSCLFRKFRQVVPSPFLIYSRLTMEMTEKCPVFFKYTHYLYYTYAYNKKKMY